MFLCLRILRIHLDLHIASLIGVPSYHIQQSYSAHISIFLLIFHVLHFIFCILFAVLYEGLINSSWETITRKHASHFGHVITQLKLCVIIRLSTLISCKCMLMSNLKASRSFVMNLSVRPVSLFIWPFHLYPRSFCSIHCHVLLSRSEMENCWLVLGQHSVQLVGTPHCGP